MTFLGHERGTDTPIHLDDHARRQGVYIIGTIGTGKTTLLHNICCQDIASPERPGLCVLDPHGDFIDDLLARIPPERADDVILFAPGDREQLTQPLGLNLLSCDTSDPKQVYRITSTVVDTLRKLFAYSWGPRMEDLLRHSVLTLMETPGSTLLELLLILASPEHRSRFTANLKDPVLRHFWDVQFASYDRYTRVEVVGSSLNKIGRFLANPLIRNIVAQRNNAFDMRRIMDEGKILLVNLSKGDLGEDNAALLGAVLVNLVLIGALQRREVPPSQRRRFHLVVDEYQNFATESFPTLQSEARKYGIDVIVAHQYRDQLDMLNKGSTLNAANFITFRVTGLDSWELSSQFDNTPPDAEMQWQAVRVRSEQFPGFFDRGLLDEQVLGPRRLYTDVQAERANDLSTFPNFTACCRLVSNQVIIEKVIETAPLHGEPNSAIAAAIRQRSAALGIAKETIENDIVERMGDMTFDDIPPYEVLPG